MSWKGYLAFGALLVIATALSVAARDTPHRSDLPSIHSNGRRGLRALYLYLKGSGRPVSSTQGSLEHLPPRTRTLIIAEPTEREISEAEVHTLQALVQSGGALVYLSPENPSLQPRMARWLELTEGGELVTDRDRLEAAQVKVWLPRGVLSGLTTLQVAADSTVDVGASGAVPVAGQPGGRVALWREQLGKGVVWIAGGADLAENRWLDQGDNLAFWDRLSRQGPMVFDEGHHLPPPPLPLSAAIGFFALQLLVVGAAFVWAQGTRLGPPRPEPVVRHRASREYLDAFAWLTRRARVERELTAQMYERLRRLMHERLGTPLSLSDEEAARQAFERCGLDPQRLVSVARRLRERDGAPLRGRRFAALAREVAELEQHLRGQEQG